MGLFYGGCADSPERPAHGHWVTTPDLRLREIRTEHEAYASAAAGLARRL
ncbi:hypothetical protein BJ997_004307 [Cryobacterium roopkundense]|uniref:Uncharacterized protein n=1 Tax=Cryobacterium roopkundense TaxID=1001240 RepID=A0A7W9A0R6_9MICO|nr:hypothetical protein [Cryobacterium roopkundense]